MASKNKREEQAARRQVSRAERKRKRADQSPLKRPKPTLTPHPIILIVCEGENTEPDYFKRFHLGSATVKPVGEGYNTISLVHRAEELSKKSCYDQIWCVFDKDDFTNQDFNNAIKIAKSKKFGVAYSNQAFEYWLLLHFNDHQGGALHRSKYNKMINRAISRYGVSYDGEKTKRISKDFFDLMMDRDEQYKKRRVELAIERAKRIYNRLDHNTPANEESSTTVFLLVEEILRYV